MHFTISKNANVAINAEISLTTLATSNQVSVKFQRTLPPTKLKAPAPLNSCSHIDLDKEKSHDCQQNGLTKMTVSRGSYSWRFWL